MPLKKEGEKQSKQKRGSQLEVCMAHLQKFHHQLIGYQKLAKVNSAFVTEPTKICIITVADLGGL